MSSESQIGAPFALASLPRPTSTTAGRTQAAGVYSIIGAKRRKRGEIAVAVDGEGILIYSLQSPQLVTSYALPPQTSFTTAPYSIYRKGASKQSSVRSTYVAATQSGSGDRPQIICFTEEARKDGTSDTAKTAYTIPKTDDQVLAIESLSLSGDADKSGSHDVVVVLASGHVICLSSDLASVKWDAELGKLSQAARQAKEEGVLRLEFVTFTTAKAAIGGLLRSRQDIAAILDPSLEGTSEVLNLTPVICAIFHLPSHGRALGLFNIQPRSVDIISTRLLPLKHLVTWDLPMPSSPSTPVSLTPQGSYQLHSPSGILHQLADSRLLSYDFSGTVPRLYCDFSVPGSTIGSFLRLSPDLILMATDRSLCIFDVKYGSVQSLLSLGPDASAGSDSKKRKHADHELSEKTHTMPMLVSYFTESHLAVGVSNHEVVGMTIAEIASRKRFKSNSTLLIDAIGKGIPSAQSVLSGQSSKESSLIQDWDRRVPKLDKYASKGKVADFEKQLAAHLGIELADSNSTAKNEDSTIAQATLENGTGTPASTNGTTEDTLDEELRKWHLPAALPDSQRSRFRHCALYALRKIFHYAENASSTTSGQRRSSLKIEFFPPNVFQWLLLSGYVTKESICRAIKESSPNDVSLSASIADGDIAKAIVQFDPELHILSAVLNHGQFLPVGEVVQAVRVLMQSLDDRPTAQAVTGLLTNGNGPSEDEMDVELTSELDAATHDLDHAMSILDNGLLIRSHNLRPALIRLHTFPESVIASALRSMLPRRELESLIRVLHNELRNGGWTSPYDFLDAEMLPADATTEDPDDKAVAIIASLLGCALDAIGAGAWLASIGDSASEESSEDIIQDLLQDTSEALNGFWEARFMRGLLSEFLRYASNLPKSQKPSNKTLEKQGKPFAPDVATDEALPMLPLGGKVDLGVERTKPGKGGKREGRSAREIGMLISKRVPKYSFERIVI